LPLIACPCRVAFHYCGHAAGCLAKLVCKVVCKAGYLTVFVGKIIRLGSSKAVAVRVFFELMEQGACVARETFWAGPGIAILSASLFLRFARFPLIEARPMQVNTVKEHPSEARDGQKLMA
jgi:hypothetical protein